MLIDFSVKPPRREFYSALLGNDLRGYRDTYGRGDLRRQLEQVTPEAMAQFVAELKNNGARAVIRGLDAETTMGHRIPNEVVAEIVAAHPDCFIGFAGVDPRKGRQAVADLEHAIEVLGLRGLNLMLFENELAPNDRRNYPLFERCEHWGIPVNIHSSMHFARGISMRYGHPSHLDDVAIDFPNLKIVAAPPGFPWVLELIAVAWRHPNVHIGLAAVRPRYLAKPGSGYEPLVTYGNSILQDRIIFGSSYPLLSPFVGADEIRALPLKEEVKDKWLHHNAARLLGLTEATGAS